MADVSIRVLLVEDDRDAREMYALALQFAGIVAKTTASAEHAFSLAASWQPDVVITDFILHSALTGADLCRRLHDDERTKHLPILVMTGSSTKADVEMILGAGCADIRLKPYLPDAMIADIHMLTERASSRRTA